MSHLFFEYSSTMAKCARCGQVRQSVGGRTWVVTHGVNEPVQSYADVLAGAKVVKPDPELCCDRDSVAMPLNDSFEAPARQRSNIT